MILRLSTGVQFVESCVFNRESKWKEKQINANKERETDSNKKRNRNK